MTSNIHELQSFIDENKENLSDGSYLSICELTQKIMDSSKNSFYEIEYLESFITNGFDYALSNGLIVDDKLSRIGRLIVESRLDVGDGITLTYAWNISNEVFKIVFKIICALSYLKHGIGDFFQSLVYKDKI